MLLKDGKTSMDIEARFRQISENKSASPSEFDALYFDIIETFSGDPKQLDNHIGELKALCLTRAIDHSKYKYRGASAADKKQTKPLSPLQNSARPSIGQANKLVNVGGVVRLCREKVSFLSFSLFKFNIENSSGTEQLKVLYSESINEDWIHKTFRPDSADKISSFQVTSLDSSCSWVVLCLFHSSDRNVVEQLQQLLNDNEDLLILDLADFEGCEIEGHCWKKDRKKLFNGTVPNQSSLLIHDLLNAEQECLIKDFFGPDAGFLVCSDLKGGLSGARVILVAPNIGLGDPRKHVIKVCKKTKSKLKQEHENFQRLVAPFWIPDQHMTEDFKESLCYEAIRYPFASKDTISSSNSFTTKYRACQRIEVLQTVVGNIFNHTLFQKWREHSKDQRKTFTAAFEQMLNIADSKKTLEQLLSPAFSAVIELNQVQLEDILNVEIEILECPNHGDLHSDNIQIQDESNDVFLIDFGLTGIYPAGLDYAALEASIRFKLLDYSVDQKILLPCDADPLSKFDNLIMPGEPLTGEVDKAVKVCSMIRQTFLNDFSEKGKNLEGLKIQYLCCLLALCLRQIKYQELNRRYILQIMSQIIPALHNHLM